MKKVIILISSLFFMSFAFYQTKTELKSSDISKVITGYIAKNFSGYSLEKAFKVINKGEVSTQVMISKGSEELALTFDKDFKLTKKEAIKPDVKVSQTKDDKKPLPPVKVK